MFIVDEGMVAYDNRDKVLYILSASRHRDWCL